jgi:hypothetical protein
MDMKAWRQAALDQAKWLALEAAAAASSAAWRWRADDGHYGRQ